MFWSSKKSTDFVSVVFSDQAIVIAQIAKNKINSQIKFLDKLDINNFEIIDLKIFNSTSIYNFIKDFIDKHKPLCNDIIKLHALEKFNKLYPEKTFNASDGWCNMFKKKMKLKTVKISISKIASITYTKTEIDNFLKECKDALLEVGPNFFSI